MALRCVVLIVAIALSLQAQAEPDDVGGAAVSAAQEFFEFLKEGTVKADIRARWENARIDNEKVGNAATLRTRLGYGTKPWKGFSIFAEFENIASANDSIYWDGIDTNDSNRTIVADPNATELNQAYGDIALTTLGSFDLSETKTSVRGGRQRIILDDARFVGNVVWRQNEQTFDAVKGLSSLGIKGLTAFYAYMWEARRIYGDNGASGSSTRNYGGDSHFVNLRFDGFDAAKITAFVYLMDFGNSPSASGVTNSSNSYGFRVTGALPVSDALEFVYAGSYAFQQDAGENPASYDADYGAIDLSIASGDLGSIGVGYEVLGSDNKASQFLTPIATAHKFNGYADAFLDNGGPVGLRDAYVYLAPDLPYDLIGSIAFHQFWSDSGTKRGTEIDAVVSRKFFKYVTLLSKFAWYKGQNINDVTGGRPDRYRVWLEAVFAF